MKIDKEKIKSFMPFIVVGAGAGVVGLFLKSKNGTTSTVTQADTTGIVSNSATQTTADNIGVDAQNNLNSAMQQNAKALSDQKTYYDDLTSKLQASLTSDETSINSLTNSQISQQNKIDANTEAATNLGTNISGISSSIGGMASTINNIQNNTTHTGIIKPNVTVISGSVDEAILKAEYGNSINYVNGQGLSGIASNRQGTSSLYDEQLSSQGVSKSVSLSDAQMNNVKGSTYGG